MSSDLLPPRGACEAGLAGAQKQAERLDAGLFQHVCTSILVEDWSHVGRALAALRQAGIPASGHFAANPGLVRRLHESVRIVDVNEATLDLMGAIDRSALIGRLIDVVPASVLTFNAWLAALARGDRTFRCESQVRRADGMVRDCLVMAVLPLSEPNFAHIHVSITDVTDYKADQARLGRAERDAARVSRLLTVGVLTGSIAHEVNNPLAAAITNAEAALRWLHRPDADIAEAIAAIEGAVASARRAQDVVDRTRRLVTSGALHTQDFDPAATLESAVAIMARELREAQVTVSVEVAPETARVQADAVRTEQVLVNLLQNAIRAISSGNGGERRIALRAAPHADGVLMSVHDTGGGILDEIRDRLFEPFATTRPDGMGLGLAVCKACVEAHGGRLWVEGPCGARGATFCFTLPAAPRS